jgi:site-specific DNA-methyltransferase (cytosine-N4-specific)
MTSSSPASINFNSLYHESKHCKLFLGNALTVLKSLPTASIDMCMTSPPYWALRSYQTQPQIWDGDPDCSHVFHERQYTMHNGRGDAQKSAKYSEQESIADREMMDAICLECGAWRGELGLEPLPSMFVKHLVTIFDEVYRVLKPSGSCFVVIGDTYSGSGGAGGDYNDGGLREGQPRYRQDKPKDIPRKSLCLVPERFAIAMIEHQWTLRNKIVWNKPNALPNSIKDRFSVSHEYVYFFTKSPIYYFETQHEPYKTIDVKKGGERFSGTNKQAGSGNRIYSGEPREPQSDAVGRIMRDVWTINTRAYEGAHFATFPEELCSRPIKAGCPVNGTVIDPFCGS